MHVQIFTHQALFVFMQKTAFCHFSRKLKITDVMDLPPVAQVTEEEGPHASKSILVTYIT